MRFFLFLIERYGRQNASMIELPKKGYLSRHRHDR